MTGRQGRNAAQPGTGQVGFQPDLGGAVGITTPAAPPLANPHQSVSPAAGITVPARALLTSTEAHGRAISYERRHRNRTGELKTTTVTGTFVRLEEEAHGGYRLWYRTPGTLGDSMSGDPISADTPITFL